MAKDDGEYEETKVRVYKKTHHKGEPGTMDKYFVAPLKKVFTKDGGKEKRLKA